MDLTGDTVAASNLIAPNTAHGADGQAIVGTATQGITPTGTINITVNDTYDVTNYASAVVNVAGGSSRHVTGTFKGTTTGAAINVTLNYSGNGYPIAVLIYPTEGPRNSTSGSFYSLVQRYAMVYFSGIKDEIASTPTYDNANSNNAMNVYGKYKNSSSTASSHGGTASDSSNIFRNTDAGAVATTCVRFKSAKNMSVFIASTSYGFAANIEYTYHVIYSS